MYIRPYRIGHDSSMVAVDLSGAGLLTPEDARTAAKQLVAVADTVEESNARDQAERTPQLRMDADDQAEMPV